MSESNVETPPVEPVVPVEPTVGEGALSGDTGTQSVEPETTPTGETIVAEPTSWLPEDLRGNEKLKDFADPEALARAYLNAPPPQEIPESYTLPEGMSAKMGDWAKENGFTQAQLDNVLKLQEDFRVYQANVANKVYTDGRKQLFDSWGENKDANLKIAESVLSAVPSGQKLAQVLKQTGEGGNPLIIGFLHEVGSFLKEGGYLKGATPKPADTENPLKKRYPTMFPTEE